MAPAYASRLKLRAHHTNVGAQKIDGSTFQTFEIVFASFQVEDKLGKARFFQEIFLLADISTEVVLGILFLTFSNADVQFKKKELIWRSYTIAKVLPTTMQVELIDKKEFAKAALDENFETFVVYIASFDLAPGIHPDRETQITFLFTKNVKILDKYSDYTDVFSEEKAVILPERTNLNEHAIKLENGK